MSSDNSIKPDSSRAKSRAWDFPALRHTFALLGQETADLEDAQFYPYTNPGVDPVVAVCNLTHVLVIRLPKSKNDKVEIIQAIRDDDLDAGNNSLVWSKTRDGIPLLCIAGRNAKIKVVNALTGRLRQTLVGHGGGSNDLAISPINPEILASASDDLTIRIWSLNPAHKDKPCVAILAGEGHRSGVLSITFHPCGRYLLSGGDDHVVNLWVLPDFPDKNTGTDHPTQIHYPHFSTSEVHSNIVDCVAFYGDLVLSKAWGEECIVLWSITGFDSSEPPPPYTSAPTNHDNHLDTRSTFSSSSDPQYQRLLQFAIPDCNEIYMRFGLYSPLTTTTEHPILALCNSKSEMFFWDMARLEAYHDFINEVEESNLTTINRPSWLAVKLPIRKAPDNALKRVREHSPTSSVVSTPTNTSFSEVLATDTAEFQSNKESWDRRYQLGKSCLLGGKRVRDNMIQPHRTVSMTKYVMTGRRVAWSIGGEWVVVVGSPHVIGVFGRNV